MSNFPVFSETGPVFSHLKMGGFSTQVWNRLGKSQPQDLTWLSQPLYLFVAWLIDAIRMDGWMAGGSGFVEFKPNLKQTNWMNLIGLFEMNGLNGWMDIIELLIQAVGNHLESK